jgi:hypothetical protein
MAAGQRTVLRGCRSVLNIRPVTELRSIGIRICSERLFTCIYDYLCIYIALIFRSRSSHSLYSSKKSINFPLETVNMADAAAPTRGGFGGRGRGGDRGGRGRGRGRRGPRKDEEKEWVPVTKLGRLVRAGKIKSIEVQSFIQTKSNHRKSTYIPSLSKNIKLSTISSLNLKMRL